MSDSLIGIVLMGGRSTRMGKDKSQLTYGGHSSSLSYNSNKIETTQTDKKVVPSSVLQTQNVPRTTTFASLAHSKLKCYVEEVYFSINKDQQHLNLEKTIIDELENEGPLSGILSALRAVQSSILVLGVDLPLIHKRSIKNLINHRNWDLLTTTYYNEQDKKWEPMLSIWEIETLPCLEKYVEEGGRSIQHFLNQYGNQRVSILHPEEFTNVNTVEAYESLNSIV